MTTTFRNVFNEFDDDFLNIDESSICESIGINIDDIKNRVFSRIKAEIPKNQTSKKFTKRLTTLLLAATLLVSTAVGTIYASGGVQPIFQEFFGGNMNSAGLYNGEDITLTSTDPNLNVKLLGVTGDERRLYTVLEITKKDGSTITDEGYEYPFLVENEHKSLWEKYECYSSYTDTEGNYFGPRADLIDYSLSNDRKTLKMMFFVSARDKNLQGSTLTITSKSFGATKMIEPFAEKYAFNEVYDLDLIKQRQQELGVDNSQCGEIYNGKYYEYGYTDTKQYELPFKMSFKVNIGDEDVIETKLTEENAPDFINPITDEANMEITSFGINIQLLSECDSEYYSQRDKNNQANTNNEEVCYKPIDYKNSEIIMNDGTEYFLYEDSDICTKGVVQDGNDYYYEENIILSLSSTPYGSVENEILLIDTSEIRTVIINDNVIYRK